MSAPKVRFKATFVSTKAGNNSPIRIDSPIDILEYIGDLSIHGYGMMKEKLQEMVDNVECRIFFHKDSANVYELDDNTFANGAIYDLK